MNVRISVDLSEGEAFTTDPVEIVDKLGLDPTKDTVSVSVSAGYTPPPPSEPASK